MAFQYRRLHAKAALIIKASVLVTIQDPGNCANDLGIMLSFADLVMSFRTHDPTHETTLENHGRDNNGNGADMVSGFGVISCLSVYFDASELIIKASDSLLLRTEASANEESLAGYDAQLRLAFFSFQNTQCPGDSSSRQMILSCYKLRPRSMMRVLSGMMLSSG